MVYHTELTTSYTFYIKARSVIFSKKIVSLCYILLHLLVIIANNKKSNRVLENIEQKYTSLISNIKDTVYRLALSLVGNTDEAQDIVQDTYERVWRARDSILAHDYPRAYVCRITRNLAIDYLRKRQRIRECDDGYQTIASDGDRIVELLDITKLTRQIIDTLPDKQRITIHMRDVEGFEIEEIAEILESDQTSVRMNLSRARKYVREQVIKAMRHGTEQH